MTPAQSAAFTAASGGQASEGVLLAVASIVIVFALTWLAWASVRFLERWRRGDSEFGDLAWYVIRGATLLSVLGWFIR